MSEIDTKINIWGINISNIVRARFAMRLVMASLLLLTFSLVMSIPRTASAAEGINRTLNFQGRLLRATGGVVPDGRYNVQFKIYEGGTGTAASNPDGTLKWTETYVNNNANSGIEVSNGLISINLGAKTPFGTSVNWNQDTLFLSINVAGSAATCTSFGTGACLADGEMVPMKRLTSTPYALNAAAVNGKTAGDFVQLGQGVQNDFTVGMSSIFINKVTSGNLIQLQNGGSDVFTVNQGGDLVFGNSSDHNVNVGDSSAGNAGKSMTVRGGNGGSGSGTSGGSLILKGGTGGGTNGNGGNVILDAGTKTGTGTDGYIAIGTNSASNILIGTNYQPITQNILIGNNNTAGGTSNIFIGAGSSAAGGITSIQSKDNTEITTNGTTRAVFDTNGNLTLGNGTASATPSNFKIQGTASTVSGTRGGNLTVQGGNATSGNTSGGNLTLSGGSGVGTGTSGLVLINTPTFSTAATDTSCYTSGGLVATSCTITSSSINNSSAVIAGFSATGQTASVPDPTLTTAGRIYYVMGAATSQPFSLSVNGGGTGNTVTMTAGSAVTLMWNGTDWIVTGTSSATAALNAKSIDGTNFQIGDGTANSTTNLLTLDKATTAPSTALLGSMYYDTTAGKVQCYEATGWGACGNKPDTFVALAPQYAGGVVNTATGTGNMTTNFCSDTLNVNDGSSSQPTVCSTNETANYYQWTATTTAVQTRSIYVTYKLPSNFKKFVANSTTLRAKTVGSANASVAWQLYRSNASGTTPCSAQMTASTGVQTTWQTSTATSTNDPTNCTYAAGENIVVRIAMNSSSTSAATAYVSDLNFAFTNN